MNNYGTPTKGKGSDSDILFSKTVRAGKRMYYIDVKRDRRDEYYLSITESKRLKDVGDAEHPVFEKHKLFLYREDLEKFQYAFNEALDYIREKAPEATYASDWSGPANDTDEERTEYDATSRQDFNLNIEF